LVRGDTNQGVRDDYYHNFAKQNFNARVGRGGLKGLTGQTVPRGYKFDSQTGYFTRVDATGKIHHVAATTSSGNKWSRVNMSPGSSKSFEELYITMGHEFIHVKNNFSILNVTRTFTENAAYSWQFDASVSLNYFNGMQSATQGLLNNYLSAPKYLTGPNFPFWW